MKNGEPHLTDFGLARLMEGESTVTRTLEVMGTPSYMAPEQAAGKRCSRQQRHRCLWARRGLLPIADRPSTLCWRNDLRNVKLVLETRAAPTAPAKSQESIAISRRFVSSVSRRIQSAVILLLLHWPKTLNTG